MSRIVYPELAGTALLLAVREELWRAQDGHGTAAHLQRQSAAALQPCLVGRAQGKHDGH